MSESTLTLENPLVSRLKAWMDERFPLVNGLLCVFLYFAAAMVGRAIATDTPVSLGLLDVVGALATWSFFLLLRVYDEHKDYELDVKNHPQRILQSGLITLNHLKALGGAAIVFQLVLSIFIDKGWGAATQAWLLMFIYSALMAKEFFIGEWLEKNLVLYALSHMAIMPLIMWWIVQMGAPGLPLQPLLMVLGALFFVSGFAFEICRKTRGPEEERNTVDSYSKIFGTRGAACVVLLLVTSMVGLQFYVVNQLSTGIFWSGFVVLAVGASLPFWSLFKFLSAPSLKARERNEACVALSMLLGYGVLIAAVVVEQGVSFTAI